MKKLISIFFLSVFLIACGARVPSPQTAQSSLTQHFKKYGKKYRETDYGQYPVTKVEINAIEEIQKDLVSIDAYVILGDGQALHKVNAIAQKKALKWKVVSWENVAGG